MPGDRSRRGCVGRVNLSDRPAHVGRHGSSDRLGGLDRRTSLLAHTSLSVLPRTAVGLPIGLAGTSETLRGTRERCQGETRRAARFRETRGLPTSACMRRRRRISTVRGYSRTSRRGGEMRQASRTSSVNCRRGAGGRPPSPSSSGGRPSALPPRAPSGMPPGPPRAVRRARAPGRAHGGRPSSQA